MRCALPPDMLLALEVVTWRPCWVKPVSAVCRWTYPGSAQLEVLSLTAEADLLLFLQLHTKWWPPFIKDKSWLRLVTQWGCACHPGHTLCQLKLFFISWLTDSSLIVLLFFFSTCEKTRAWTWECVAAALALFGEKIGRVWRSVCDRISNVVTYKELISSSWDLFLLA